jgi:hypothetical protein
MYCVFEIFEIDLQTGTYVDSSVELMAIATVLQTHIRILSRSPSDTDTDVIREVLVTPRSTVLQGHGTPYPSANAASTHITATTTTTTTTTQRTGQTPSEKTHTESTEI